MKVAVMSDLHDNVAAWKIINLKIEQAGIMTLINCGDTTASAMLMEMSDTFAGHIHTILGNVADVSPDPSLVKEMDNITQYGQRGELELFGKKIAFVHRPTDAQPLITSGQFDLVCHGHTHLKRWEKLGRTYVLNPGTAGGMFQYPSFAIVDLEKMHNDFIDVTF